MNCVSKSKIYSIYAFVCLGMLITIYGLSKINPSVALLSLQLLTSDFIYLMAFVLIVGLVIEFCSRRFLLNRLTVGAVLIVLLIVAAGMLWQLFICISFGLSCFIVGRGLLRLLGVNAEVFSGAVHFLVGAAIIATLIGLWAHTPYNYPGVYGFVLFGPLLFEKGLIRSVIQSVKNQPTQTLAVNLLDTIIATVVLVYLLLALMPEVGQDALAMHLFLPEYIAHNHQWTFDVTKYVWAVMPMQAGWVYTLVNMLAGEYAVRLVNVSFIFILCWLIHDLVRWAGGSDKGSRWAIVIFLLTPLTFLEASSSYTESIWSAFIVAGILSVLKLTASDNKRENLFVAAILLSSALATKAVTFMVLPVLLLLLAFTYRRWFEKSLMQSIFLGLMIFFIIGGVPYLTAFLISANPVFPFFNGYFLSPQYVLANFEASTYGKGVAWDTIYKITFDASVYLEGRVGSAGFQWILLLLPSLVLLLVVQQRKGLILVFVAISIFILTFYQTAYLRYVFPSVVILCAVVGISLSNSLLSQNRILRRFLWIPLIATIVLNAVFLRSATQYGAIEFYPIFSENGRKDYLASRLPIRNAISLINELNYNKTSIALFSYPSAAGVKAEVLFPNWYNFKFQSLIFSPNTPQEMSHILHDNGVEFIILDETWNHVWYTKDIRLILHEVTEHVQSFGVISIRRVKPQGIELIRDMHFIDDGAWVFSEGAKKNSPGVTVSVNSPVMQAVPAQGKRKYLLAVKASCEDSIADVRMQINWMDKNANFIESFIKVVECSWATEKHEAQVFSPDNASLAIVFATGHTVIPINIEEVSFSK